MKRRHHPSTVRAAMRHLGLSQREAVAHLDRQVTGGVSGWSGRTLAPGGPSASGKSTATVRAHLRLGRPVKQHVRHLSPHAKQALKFYRGLKPLGVSKARRTALSFFYGRPTQGSSLTTIGRGPNLSRRAELAVRPKVGWRP